MKNKLRQGSLLAAVTAVLGVLLVGSAPPASAVQTGVWGDWSPLSGAGGNYTTGFTLAGTPEITAQATSSSRAGSVGVITGASSWLAASTPVGQKYGSSQDRPYLNLRPAADNATSPSITTYTFTKPTPTTNWAFVLGDIDADLLQISGVTAAGNPLTATDLGYRGGFNYCAPEYSGKPSCTGDSADIPAWDPSTMVLMGNAGADDTRGSSAWFEPSVPLAELTFTFTQRSGFPVYQTWFASLTRDITGTVSAETGDGSGVSVTLTDPAGATLASTVTGPGGSYTFAGVQASDGYNVTIQPPSGQVVSGQATKTANLASADAIVDFALRDYIPARVSGVVLDEDGAPIQGATVTIAGVGTATTGSDGRYEFVGVPPGTYQPQLTVPAGYRVTITAPEFTIGTESQVVITNENFVVEALHTVSGTVTVAGAPKAGVTVTLSGPSGSVSTTSLSNGTYSFADVPDANYTLQVVPPTGTVAVSPVSRVATVDGNDLTDLDFAFARTGSIAGSVSGDGAPLPGVTVTISGPDGDVTVETKADGSYSLADLPPGTYKITVATPEGYSSSTASTRTVTITASGESYTAQNFSYVTVSNPDPPVTQTPGQPQAGYQGLASTGSSASHIGITAFALLFAAACVATGSRITRPRRARASDL